MKKRLLTVFISLAWTSAFPQGFINFGNAFSGTQGRFPIYGPGWDETLSLVGQSDLGVPSGNTVYAGPLLQGTGYTLALFAGPSTVTDPNSLTFVTSASFRTASANVLPAGLVLTTTVAVDGVLPGSAAKFEYRAWDNRGGTLTTWQECLLATHLDRGRSGLFTSGPLGGVAPDGSMYLTPNAAATSFNIYWVPEPDAAALALTATALIVLRQRRQDAPGMARQFFGSGLHPQRGALPR